MKKTSKFVSLLALILLASCQNSAITSSSPKDSSSSQDISQSTVSSPDSASSTGSNSSSSIATYYTITFDLDGGEISDPSLVKAQKVEAGHWAKKPSVDPVKNHCTFAGWYDSDDNKFNFNNPVWGDVTVKAKWDVNEEEKITLTFDPNNGEAKYTIETFLGDRPNVKVPSKSGYVFVGWYVNGDKDKRWTGYVTDDFNEPNITLVALYEVQDFNFKFTVKDDNTICITGIIKIDTVDVQVPAAIGSRTVTEIGEKAFQSRIYIERISLPATITKISPKAFMGARKLTEISVDSANQTYKSKDGILYSKDEQTLVFVPQKALTSSQSFDCPATLKKIGDYAFYGQGDVGLKTINLNDGLEEIGEYAFYDNELLTSITFPSSLKKIGKAAFEILTSTSNQFMITWSEGLEEIGESAFVGLYLKDALKLPDSVKIIGDYAFNTPSSVNCGITSVKLPASLESFGDGVFFYGLGIETMTLASSNTHFTCNDGILTSKDGKILYYVASDSHNSRELEIPQGVEEIKPHALSEARYYTELVLPSTLKKIDDRAFHYNKNLGEVILPDSVTEIGEEAFMMSSLSSITLGRGIAKIPEACFDECKKLKSVTIPSNVKVIEDSAFAMTSLAEINFSEGLEEIGDAAFYYSATSGDDEDTSVTKSGLKELEFPDSLKKIGDYAFYGHAALTDVTFGASLTDLGASVFSGNTNTGTAVFKIHLSDESQLIQENSQIYTADGKKVLYCEPDVKNTLKIRSTVEVIPAGVYANLKGITNVTLPSGLKSIGDYAFSRSFTSDKNGNYPSLALPSTVTEIGEGAFYNASIKGITLNEGLVSIGDYAFQWINSVGALSLPSTLKKVGEGAFEMCGVTSVTLNEGLEEIGKEAFSRNPSLSGEITIPASLKTLGDGAFIGNLGNFITSITSFKVNEGSSFFASKDGALFDKDMTTLYQYPSASSNTSFALPATTKVIKTYALAGAQKLTSLTLNEGLEEIGEEAFSESKKIALIKIPSSVTAIGRRAFKSFTNSQKIQFALASYDDVLIRYGNEWMDSCNATLVYGA